MNVMYPFGREGILDESIKMQSRDIRAMLVSSDYLFDREHFAVSDVAQFDNGRSIPLAGKTFVDGVFDADDTWLTPIDAIECGALVYFQDAVINEASRLICFIDQPSSGLPLTPMPGRRTNIEHANGPNRIFRL